MTKTGATEVVCDAGPLIHLDELGCLDLLNDFSGVLVPPLVWAEVIHHRSGFAGQKEVQFQIMRPASALPSNLAILMKSLSLHRGEVEALHLAQERPGYVLLSDDMAARLAGRQLGVTVHGTVGVIVRSLRTGRKSKDEVLDTLRGIPKQSSLYIKLGLLKEIISKVEAHQK